MRLVLDTSAYSHFRANHKAVVDLVAKADTVYLPTIVLGELEAAFRRGSRAADNRGRLDAFLAEDFVQVLPVTADVARCYGQLFAALRTAGTPLPINDVWIAATTLDAGAHLLTFDSDFEHVERLDRTILRP
jgi:tRNA(fMet)-specific endonuclease VapC